MSALAYAARYGNQDIGWLCRQTPNFLRKLNEALGDIVRRENAPRNS